MKAYAYVRVSTRIQAEKDTSLQEQESACRKYYDYKLSPKVEWGGIFQDPAVSAKIPLIQREAGCRLACTVTRGDHVIFAKLDRGFRNVVDLLTTVDDWALRGVTCHFLDVNLDTSTDLGRVILTMLGAFAEWERKRIATRIKDAFVGQRSRGAVFVPWHAPYPLKLVGKGKARRLVYSAQQRSVGQSIVQWKDQGYGAQVIYRHLKDTWPKDLPGLPQNHQVVLRMYYHELVLRDWLVNGETEGMLERARVPPSVAPRVQRAVQAWTGLGDKLRKMVAESTMSDPQVKEEG